jgi:hypothetical protein
VEIYASKLKLISTNLRTRVVQKILEQNAQSGENRDLQLSLMSNLVKQVDGDDHVNTILGSGKVQMRGLLLKKLNKGGLLIRGIRDKNDVLVSKQLDIVEQSDIDVALEQAVKTFQSGQQAGKNFVMARMILSLVAERAAEKAVASIKPSVTQYTWGIIQRARAKIQTSD